jgi:hypothetical protein
MEKHYDRMTKIFCTVQYGVKSSAMLKSKKGSQLWKA